MPAIRRLFIRTAGVIGIGAVAFFAYVYALTRWTSPESYTSLAATIVAALIGICAGFLPHNFHPATIFMGDSGSMQLGKFSIYMPAIRIERGWFRSWKMIRSEPFFWGDCARRPPVYFFPPSFKQATARLCSY